MLKTASAVDSATLAEVGDKEHDGKRIQMKNRNEKNHHRRAVKANKRQNPKNGSERKNWRPPELKTLVANQHRSSPPKQEKHLPN